jgi:hypothetical protein
MRSLLRPHPRPLALFAALAALTGACPLACAAGPVSPAAEEAPFLSENGKAMTKMMDDMSIEPTGDIDRDFVAMMAPHHQGAIDMAKAELRYGHNERLRRIAQEIVIEQQQEIAAMRLALDQSAPASDAAPAHPMSPAIHMNMQKEPR